MATAMVREEFPAVAGSVGAARRWVVGTLGLQGRAAEDVGILVSELVTNSVLHAGLPAGARIVVQAGPGSGGGVRIEVCDEGGRFGRESASPDRRGRGRGLKIVEALSTSWGVHHDGHTRTWAEYVEET